MAQCTARSKRTGERCKRAAMKGQSVCAIHGGKSLKGTAAPNFKHGRYSKYLPERLQERYLLALDDEELLAQRDEIAVLESRLTELMGGLDRGESGRMWDRLSDVREDMEAARIRNDTAALARALTELSVLISQGASERERWSEVYEVLDRRRVLVESERRRLVDMQQMITAQQAILLMRSVESAMVEAVRQHVPDVKQQRAVMAEAGAALVALLSIGDGTKA